MSGWDGSAADALIYNDARLSDLTVIPGKYYLADAGFGMCSALLIPYRGVRYHLAEWGRANVRYFYSFKYNRILLITIRPTNAQELYNLRHASARNPIERIFGVLKRRFVVLTHPPEYTMDVQVRIPPALAATHNFIRVHDPNEINDFDEDDIIDHNQGYRGELARGPAGPQERAQAKERRDEIAAAMWDSYQTLLQERAAEEADIE